MSALDVQVGGDHYKKLKIQPVEYIHANGIPFIEGCIIKYASRWRDKGGIKDLEKIKHFADLLIDLETRAAVSESMASLPAEVEAALAIDDDSPRAQILGQNGEMASEVYAAIGRPKDAPQWINAPTWATHLMERLGVYEWAMMHDGRYWDDEDTEDAGRFLLANEADGTPWTVIEARPCQ